MANREESFRRPSRFLRCELCSESRARKRKRNIAGVDETAEGCITLTRGRRCLVMPLPVTPEDE